MKSVTLGNNTLAVEVTHISMHGFWLLLNNEELFLPFTEFPWFKKAPVEKIMDVEWPQPNHLYWPELDIDLTVESIRDPASYPLRARIE